MVGTATIDSTAATWRDARRLSDEHSMRPRVLLVDDDPDFCRMMAQLLTSEGFEADVASNGQDGLDKAHANPPRVIVLDMMMAVMDGWRFLAHQRYDAVLGVIPVVVLSAVPPEHLDNLGAAAALQKPFHTAELIATIRAQC
jgi:DNA-binding response OmpR family regulator